MSLNTFGQRIGNAPTFEVATVKPSQQVLGRDANSRISLGPAGISGKNVTLKHLITQAYHLQPYQIFGGPGWLDVNEYDIDAKADGPSGKDRLALMLRTLLADRFRLAAHTETKELRVYELVTDKGGPKIHALKEGEVSEAASGRRFRGDLQQFANLLSVQLTITLPDDPTRPGIASTTPVPVVDKTGLSGIYEFSAEVRPEAGGDMFTLWQRVLQDQLGLKLENRRTNVEVLVVDHAERVPTGN